jgi:hypothetical protein
MNRFKSDKIVRLLGIDNFANYVRNSTHNIRAFRVGSLILGTTSLLFWYFLQDSRKARMLLESEGINKLMNAVPMDIHKYIQSNSKGGLVNHLSGITDIIYNNKLMFYGFKATGSFDHSREIHVPRVVDGKEGYDIYTPFFYFDYKANDLNTHMIYDDLKKKPDFMSEACITVNRGW